MAAENSSKTPAQTSEQTDRRYAIPVSGVLGILIVIAIYFGSMAVGQYVVAFYALLQGWSGEQMTAWLTDSSLVQFMYVLIVESLTLGLLVAYLRRRKIPLVSLGLRRPRLSDFGFTALAYPIYFSLNAVATVVAVSLLHLNDKQQQQTGFESAHTTMELALTFVSLVILPPIVEEIIMRGFLFGSLKRDLPVVKAALATSVIFAIAHLQFGQGAPLLWIAAIDTFILSLVLCYLRQKTGGLWAGIGLHALKNALAFTVLFILPHLHITFLNSL